MMASCRELAQVDDVVEDESVKLRSAFQLFGGRHEGGSGSDFQDDPVRIGSLGSAPHGLVFSLVDNREVLTERQIHSTHQYPFSIASPIN